MSYFIRTYADLSDEHFQAPRTRDSVRRSIDGTLCVVAFDDGTEPEGWDDGMSTAQMAEHLGSAEFVGVWWSDEIM